MFEHMGEIMKKGGEEPKREMSQEDEGLIKIETNFIEKDSFIW
jgi:hypothetical protein